MLLKHSRALELTSKRASSRVGNAIQLHRSGWTHRPPAASCSQFFFSASCVLPPHLLHLGTEAGFASPKPLARVDRVNCAYARHTNVRMSATAASLIPLYRFAHLDSQRPALSLSGEKGPRHGAVVGGVRPLSLSFSGSEATFRVDGRQRRARLVFATPARRSRRHRPTACPRGAGRPSARASLDGAHHRNCGLWSSLLSYAHG